MMNPEPIGTDIYIFAAADSDKLQLKVKHQHVQTEVLKIKDQHVQTKCEEGMLLLRLYIHASCSSFFSVPDIYNIIYIDI